MSSFHVRAGDEERIAPDAVGEMATPYLGPSIVINVAARELRLFDEKNTLIKTYPIAIGMGRYPTPIGKRRMVQIVWNPWWLPPDSPWAEGEVDTPPGPRNPLGPVKMNLEEAILIHGTNTPGSIGFPRSHACMRMYSADAIEVASYIQKNVTDKDSPELFESYRKNNRRTVYVALDQPVPVDIIYDVVEVKDERLYIYQDVYAKVKDKLLAVQDELVRLGYKLEKIDWDFLKEQIKNARNRKDVQVDIGEIMKKGKPVAGL